MATEVTLEYTLDVVAPQSQVAMSTKMGAVVLDTTALEAIGVTLVSDATTLPNSTQVLRTLVFSLVAPFIGQDVVTTEDAGYKGAIVSSSAADTFNAVLRFVDVDGNAGYENVKFNGTTPVPMIVGGKVRITSITPEPGATAAGMLSVFNDVALNPVTDDGKTTIVPLFVRGDTTFVVKKNSIGSIVSDSESDTFAGVGAQVISITYEDDAAVSHTESVHMSGTTPHALPNSNLAKITSAGVFAAGAVEGNVGTITFWSGPNGTGALLGTIPVSFYRYFPVGTDQKAPFYDYFTHTLSSALQSKITAHAPILS